MASDSETALNPVDMNNLNTIPSIDIFVNVSSVQDACSQWQSKINSININVEEIANSFKPLTNYGILTGYVSNLSTAIASLLSAVQTVTSTISNSSQGHDQVDTGSDNSSGNGNYSYGPGGSTYSGTDTGADNSEEDLTINPEDQITSLSYQDYLGMATALTSILKEYNFDFNKLDDDVVFQKVKAALLSSSFISAELKEKLSKYPDSSLKSMLKLLNQNKTFDNFTTENIDFVVQYVVHLAKLNNTTYDAYLAGDKKVVYNDMYYTNNALAFFDYAFKQSSSKELILNAFDGKYTTELGEPSVKAIRNVISFLASQKGQTSEQFISSCSSKDFEKAISAGFLTQELLQGDTDKLPKIISELGR